VSADPGPSPLVGLPGLPEDPAEITDDECRRLIDYRARVKEAHDAAHARLLAAYDQVVAALRTRGLRNLDDWAGTDDYGLAIEFWEADGLTDVFIRELDAIAEYDAAARRQAR
jgi:hypothetical protein